MTEVRVERRLAAILAADVVGYSRLMGGDEEGTLARLKALRKDLVDFQIGQHRGRIVKTTGDGLLVEFASAVDAIKCAVEVQAGMVGKNADVPHDRRIDFRIGIHVGDIIIDDNDIFGDGVNIAARLEGIAEPGGICISDDAHRQIRGKVDIPYRDMGPQALKNIAEPMRAWGVKFGDAGALTAATRSLAGAEPALTLPDRPSVAVLPFHNMSGDPGQDYFADGMVEDIITALSRFKSLFVIARNSSFTYKGKALDIRQVGRELGVRYVLEGSVRNSGGKVRITALLIEALTGAQVWADRIDGQLEDTFDLQDRVTARVAEAIEPSLRLAETSRLRRMPTANLNAYDLYLRALADIQALTRESLVRADEALRMAIKLDPNYSDAFATLANTTFLRNVAGWLAREEAQAIGVEAALSAVRLDPGNASAQATAAATLALLSANHDRAIEFADRALSLNRNSAQVLTFSALAYNFSALPQKALPLLHLARRIDPLDPRGYMILNQLTTAHFFAREFDEAVAWSSRNVEEHPTFTPGRRFLAASLAHLGRIEQARTTIAELLQIQPNSSLRLSRLNSYRYIWMTELFVDGLRLAGLPE